MSLFKGAFTVFAEGIQDLSSLDVVTFQGSVDVSGVGNLADLKSFDTLLDNAKGNTTIALKVLASTQTKVDGDILAFIDKDITPEQAQAHAELVLAGSESRQATIDFVKSILGGAVKDI